MPRQDDDNEQRTSARLSEATFERIAYRAAQIVEERLFAAVGRTILSKALYVLGTGGIAILVWEVAKALGIADSKFFKFFFGA